jgi:hypothetical protein
MSIYKFLGYVLFLYDIVIWDTYITMDREQPICIVGIYIYITSAGVSMNLLIGQKDYESTLGRICFYTSSSISVIHPDFSQIGVALLVYIYIYHKRCFIVYLVYGASETIFNCTSYHVGSLTRSSSGKTEAGFYLSIKYHSMYWSIWCRSMTSIYLYIYIYIYMPVCRDICDVQSATSY